MIADDIYGMSQKWDIDQFKGKCDQIVETLLLRYKDGGLNQAQYSKINEKHYYKLEAWLKHGLTMSRTPQEKKDKCYSFD